jgi:hypothetical protein
MTDRVDYYNPHPEIPSMHRLFLKILERYGRIYELGLAFVMSLKMVDPLKDIDLAWPLLTKGRFRLAPPQSEGFKELRRVVSRIREIEGES